MKILVIFTGGTIGSRIKDGWISTDSSTKYALIESYKADTDISFETEEPYFLLSENLSAKSINLLMDHLYTALSKDFDGIIVTHGTDTLHFSAAAAHLAFASADKPIVFVSANYPLENKASNGDDNFEGAVEFIKSGVKSGVYISYKNPSGEHFIHSADKALGFSENDDSIYSLNKKPFAVYKNKKVTVFGKPSLEVSVRTAFCEFPNILVISTHPADSFAYSLENCNAVILRPYHSGTLNTENSAFKAFLERAKNIPVFLVNAPEGTTYETTKEYEKLGIISLPHSTFAHTYMKIWANISESKNLF